MVEEALVEDVGSGLAPVSNGWFVVNVRDAAWEDHDVFGACCTFESPNSKFAELGFRLCVLQPGQPNGLYHGEETQEAFLVLAGECVLLVEGEERRLRAWDFFHCPGGTEHVFVGAGDGPCTVLMTGARRPGRSSIPAPRSRSGTGRQRRRRRRIRARLTPATRTIASSAQGRGASSAGRRGEACLALMPKLPAVREDHRGARG